MNMKRKRDDEKRRMEIPGSVVLESKKYVVGQQSLVVWMQGDPDTDPDYRGVIESVVVQADPFLYSSAAGPKVSALLRGSVGNYYDIFEQQLPLLLRYESFSQFLTQTPSGSLANALISYQDSLITPLGEWMQWIPFMFIPANVLIDASVAVPLLQLEKQGRIIAPVEVDTRSVTLPSTAFAEIKNRFALQFPSSEVAKSNIGMLVREVQDASMYMMEPLEGGKKLPVRCSAENETDFYTKTSAFSFTPMADGKWTTTAVFDNFYETVTVTASEVEWYSALQVFTSLSSSPIDLIACSRLLLSSSLAPGLSETQIYNQTTPDPQVFSTAPNPFRLSAESTDLYLSNSGSIPYVLHIPGTVMTANHRISPQRINQTSRSYRLAMNTSPPIIEALFNSSSNPNWSIEFPSYFPNPLDGNHRIVDAYVAVTDLDFTATPVAILPRHYVHHQGKPRGLTSGTTGDVPLPGTINPMCTVYKSPPLLTSAGTMIHLSTGLLRFYEEERRYDIEDQPVTAIDIWRAAQTDTLIGEAITASKYSTEKGSTVLTFT